MSKTIMTKHKKRIYIDATKYVNGKTIKTRVYFYIYTPLKIIERVELSKNGNPFIQTKCQKWFLPDELNAKKGDIIEITIKKVKP